MNNQHEREDKEESNVASRRSRKEDTNCPSELESSPIYMVPNMQTMKDKMDMMMNPMREPVATNLDNLVHCTNFSFMAQITSCPLPPKFQMPQIETYDGSKDLLDLK